MKMEMQTEVLDERTVMIRAAIKSCFAAHEAANVANVKAKLPSDFWTDFDTDKELDDVEKFREIQSTFTAMPKHAAAAMIEDRPDHQGKLAPAPFPDHLPPSDRVAEPNTVSEPLPHIAASEHVEAEPVEQRTAEHVPSGKPGAQARFDAARKREAALLSERPSLIQAQRAARSAVADTVRAYQEADTNRVTPEQNFAAYRKSAQAERAARVARQGTGQPRIAYVDAARKFSTGGDGNDFARRQNVSGNKRGGFSRAEATARGFVNRDPSRGGTPAPEPVARPTIPALARK
jgi:hypothetical protein